MGVLLLNIKRKRDKIYKLKGHKLGRVLVSLVVWCGPRLSFNKIRTKVMNAIVGQIVSLPKFLC